MKTPERSLVVVIDHIPWRTPDEARTSNLTDVVAIVLSTFRSEDVDMVLDHRLWLAAMAAISEASRADRCEAFVEPAPSVFDWLRRRRPRLSVGSIGRGTASFLPHGDDTGWDTILWHCRSAVVAAATCERWYLGGGQSPFHDSYTTSVFVQHSCVDAVLASLRRHVDAEGGVVESVLRSPSVV